MRAQIFSASKNELFSHCCRIHLQAGYIQTYVHRVVAWLSHHVAIDVWHRRPTGAAVVYASSHLPRFSARLTVDALPVG